MSGGTDPAETAQTPAEWAPDLLDRDGERCGQRLQICEHLMRDFLQEWDAAPEDELDCPAPVVATIEAMRSFLEESKVRAEPAEDDAPDLSELLGMTPLSGDEFARKISTGVLPVCDHPGGKP